MIGEDEGCEILERVFTERGFSIVREFPFREGAIAFEVDGWDPEARIGFEYLTREAGDHDDLTRIEFEKLTEAMRRGELYIFVIDEGEIESEEELVAAAHAFIDETTIARAKDITEHAPPARAPAALPPKQVERMIDEDDARPAALSPRVVEAAARAAAVVSAPRAAPVTSIKAASPALAKKPAAKKTAKKSSSKKAAKKSSSKKAAKKASSKKPAKKASSKKPAKKASSKKPAKKASSKKTAKKASSKKTAKKTAKKSSSKKAAKKPSSKKTAKKSTRR